MRMCGAVLLADQVASRGCGGDASGGLHGTGKLGASAEQLPQPKSFDGTKKKKLVPAAVVGPLSHISIRPSQQVRPLASTQLTAPPHHSGFFHLCVAGELPYFTLSSLHLGTLKDSAQDYDSPSLVDEISNPATLKLIISCMEILFLSLMSHFEPRSL